MIATESERIEALRKEAHERTQWAERIVAAVYADRHHPSVVFAVAELLRQRDLLRTGK